MGSSSCKSMPRARTASGFASPWQFCAKELMSASRNVKQPEPLTRKNLGKSAFIFFLHLELTRHRNSSCWCSDPEMFTPYARELVCREMTGCRGLDLGSVGSLGFGYRGDLVYWLGNIYFVEEIGLGHCYLGLSLYG